MEKISEVREKRQDRFHQARMARGRKLMQAAAKAEVTNEVHLVQAPAALLKQKQPAEKLPEKQKLRISVEAPQKAVRMAE
ncbi:hypothetical protein WJX73_009109 [Symbiochloris irregularis]|uniref:Uncharacterized protein n=1 Tax=Symbiochloris irregularis TaxID=706552 RepID=A0AAW1P2C7_9CHLO